MERKSFAQAPCSIARSLDVMGDWWTPLLIRECLYGVHRFDELQEWLGIGRNILARRLELLVEGGVLEKRRYQDHPERFEYHLTEKGYDAAGVLVAMMSFGERWYFERGREPIALYDRRTGARVRPSLVDAETGEPLDVRNLYAAPGPGFPKLSQAALAARFKEHAARAGKAPAIRPRSSRS